MTEIEFTFTIRRGEKWITITVSGPNEKWTSDFIKKHFEPFDEIRLESAKQIEIGGG